jgi:hypothetical protein
MSIDLGSERHATPLEENGTHSYQYVAQLTRTRLISTNRSRWIIYNYPTAQSRALSEKLTVSKLVKNFPAFYET